MLKQIVLFLHPIYKVNIFFLQFLGHFNESQLPSTMKQDIKKIEQQQVFPTKYALVLSGTEVRSPRV